MYVKVKAKINWQTDSFGDLDRMKLFHMSKGLSPSSCAYTAVMENVANPHPDQIINGTFSAAFLWNVYMVTCQVMLLGSSEKQVDSVSV